MHSPAQRSTSSSYSTDYWESRYYEATAQLAKLREDHEKQLQMRNPTVPNSPPRRSSSGSYAPDYWQNRYFEATSQLAKLREEFEREVKAKDALIQELQKHIETLQSQVLTAQYGATIDLTHSHVLDLATSIYGSSCVSSLDLSGTLKDNGFFAAPTRRLERIASVPESEASFEVRSPDSQEHMFEEFFILGLTNPDTTQCKPQILFQYPRLEFTQESVQYRVIPDFCYPLGCVPYPLLMNESGSALNELLYGREALYRSSNFFIFTLKTNVDTDISADWDKPNKNREVLYCVCLQTDELLIAGQEEWIYPKCLCLVSYHPCFELHFKLLTSLVALKRVRRMSAIASNAPGRTYSSTSLNIMVKQSEDLSAEEVALLCSYHSSQPLDVGMTLTLPLSSVNSLSYEYPEPWRMDTSWCCPPLLSSLTVQEFYQILSAAMQEKSIVFLSSNKGLISSCVLAIQALMRPFTWPHVAVPVMPANLLELLEAPVPILVGLPTISGLKTEDYPEIIWVKLDQRGKGSRVECGNKGLLQSIKEPWADNLKSKLIPYIKTLASSKNAWQGDSPGNEVVAIVQMITTYWKQVIACVPERPSVTVGERFLDVEQLLKAVLAKASKADHNFLSVFIHTQIFISHVEERIKCRYHPSREDRQS